MKNFDRDFYEMNYFSIGEPVPFKLKGGEIKIYPVLVKDATRYDYAKDILLIDKNKINDIEILQMSDLEFLLMLCQEDSESGKMVRQQMSLIMSLCLHEDAVFYSDKYGNLIKENGKPILVICDKDGTIKAKITSKEFNIIKKIILCQNDKDYDDTEYSEDIQEQIELWVKVKRQQQSVSTHDPTLEEKKSLLMAKNGMTESTVNNLRYRLFNMMVQNVIDADTYVGEMIIKGSYKYDVKDEVIYPIYREKKSIFEQAFVDKDKVANKLS